jgi:outer membrane protein assembly factor BamB
MYIQTITLDPKRKMIYGFNCPVFEFFAYSITEKRIVYKQFMESISHISAIDDSGGYWGTWGTYHHNLFRYEVQTNSVRFFQHGFPEKGGGIMYANAGPIDCMINGRDGFLYVATDRGSLYRLTPSDGAVEFLGRPFPFERLPGMILGDDGLIYFAGGDNNNTGVAAYDREKRSFISLGRIAAENVKCFRAHDIAKVGNSLFVAETDNPKRTNYLWECSLE